MSVHAKARFGLEEFQRGICMNHKTEETTRGILEEPIPFHWNTVGRCSFDSTVHLNGSSPVCTIFEQYTVVCCFRLVSHLSRLGGCLAQIMAKQQVTDCL